VTQLLPKYQQATVRLLTKISASHCGTWTKMSARHCATAATKILASHWYQNAANCLAIVPVNKLNLAIMQIYMTKQQWLFHLTGIMGVAVETYHSRIGSDYNFTPSKIISWLKGKFWNQMLMVFYLNAFCLPCLKSLVTRTGKSNVQHRWYICYHVYVPLLLRLSNDVEGNPGPWNIY
jgi:hypothetical protein